MIFEGVSITYQDNERRYGVRIHKCHPKNLVTLVVTINGHKTMKRR